VSGDTKAAVQSSSASEATGTHVSGQDSGIPPAPAKVKTEKELEKERKKAEKQAKFEQKKAAQAQAAAANANKTKEKKEKEKKAEVEALPPFVEDTPAGGKKRLKPFDDPYYSSYHPVAVESAWYAWWEKEGFFKPQFTPEGKVKPEGKFVVVVPPPNVTGALQ
jgi:valyl-tRNA synthetase